MLLSFEDERLAHTEKNLLELIRIWWQNGKQRSIRSKYGKGARILDVSENGSNCNLLIQHLGQEVIFFSKCIGNEWNHNCTLCWCWLMHSWVSFSSKNYFIHWKFYNEISIFFHFFSSSTHFNYSLSSKQQTNAWNIKQR